MRKKEVFEFILILLVSSVTLSIFLIFHSNNPSNTQTSDIQYQTSVNKTPIQSKKDLVQVILGGDVMLGRTVEINAKEEGDYFYPFKKISSILDGADLVFVNLENPIIENCPTHDSGFKFCSTPDMLAGLVDSGVDVVTLANNHSRNYGEAGLEETLEHLDDVGISATFNRNLIIIKVGETRFGFVGFDLLDFEPTQSDFELVKRYSEQVDVLIIGVHWGVEYESEPREYQREWAQRLVDSGADIVVGHHPHWVQAMDCLTGVTPVSESIPESRQKTNIEIAEKKGLISCPQGDIPVYYSLGNLVFDQMWSEETKKGMLVRLTFNRNKLVQQELLPTYMSSWAQPEFVE